MTDCKGHKYFVSNLGECKIFLFRKIIKWQVHDRLYKQKERQKANLRTDTEIEGRTYRYTRRTDSRPAADKMQTERRQVDRQEDGGTDGQISDCLKEKKR